MIKHIYDNDGKIKIRTEDAIPICEEDYCDHCGDCLACYGSDQCYDSSEHFWVQYGDNKNEKKENNQAE